MQLIGAKFGLAEALAPVSIADSLDRSQPDIEKAKAGNCAANKALLHPMLEIGPLRHPSLIEPEARPWEHDQDQS
jgi:hypothetical protein